MPSRIDFVGRRFGRLVVQNDLIKDAQGKYLTECLCDCDETKIVIVRKGNLTSGTTRSCGCLHRERSSDVNRNFSKIRGVSKIPEYDHWKKMLLRCRKDENYYGRGIKVCDEWQQDFDAFFAHIGPKPSKCHSVDRIDNNWHYEPCNVRWATPSEQSFNTRPHSLPAEALEALMEQSAELAMYKAKFGEMSNEQINEFFTTLGS